MAFVDYNGNSLITKITLEKIEDCANLNNGDYICTLNTSFIGLNQIRVIKTRNNIYHHTLILTSEGDTFVQFKNSIIKLAYGYFTLYNDKPVKISEVKFSINTNKKIRYFNRIEISIDNDEYILTGSLDRTSIYKWISLSTGWTISMDSIEIVTCGIYITENSDGTDTLTFNPVIRTVVKNNNFSYSDERTITAIRFY